MVDMSRRTFLQWSALAGATLLSGEWAVPTIGDYPHKGQAWAAESIKIGIIDPLSSPYKTSSIHDVHGAHVAADLFNKNGGVIGRPVVLLEADDASNADTAAKAATTFIREDRVDFLMGTFNADCALAASAVAHREGRLFMVTGALLPELTGEACNAHTFVVMPHARMLAEAVVPEMIKAYGSKWYMMTANTLDGKAAAQAVLDAAQARHVQFVGETVLPFGTTDYAPALTAAKAKNPTAIVLNLYGWDLVHALKDYGKLGLAKEKVGVGGLISGEQIGRPLGYADNAGIWGLIWDPKIKTDGSRRFIQAVIDKYNHTPTSRCYLGYVAMTQMLEAVQRAGTTETSAVIKALEGHQFDGLKEGRSEFRAADHLHVQDVLVGEAYGRELGLGHFKILTTLHGDANPAVADRGVCTM